MQQSKAYSSVRSLCCDILNRANNGKYADELLANTMNKIPLSQRDKALLVELVHGTLRWKGQLDWILQQFLKNDLNSYPDKLRVILEFTLYQVRFLNKVPDYAAISEGVEIAKLEGEKGWSKVVNGVLRTYQRKYHSLHFPSTKENMVAAIAVQYSHPEWIIKRWLRRYGPETTIKYCEYSNRRPRVSVRFNNTAGFEDALRELKKDGFDAQESTYFKNFILLARGDDILNHRFFTQGILIIQDESTALPPLLLAPKKNDTILDMCAAPGGKCCHLANLTADNSEITALDIDKKRMKKLQENLFRLHIGSVDTILADGTKFQEKQYDKILLDAPCSGLGVLGKRSDLRWRRTRDDIYEIRKTQNALLENAVKLLKPDGVLVYSTCTLEPEETDFLIEHFLARHKNINIDKSFVPDEAKPFLSKDGFFRTMPFNHNMDGTFAVRLIKRNHSYAKN